MSEISKIKLNLKSNHVKREINFISIIDNYNQKDQNQHTVLKN